MLNWTNYHSNKPIQDSFHYITRTKGLRSTRTVDWEKNITQTNQCKIAFTLPHTKGIRSTRIVDWDKKHHSNKHIQDSFHYTTHTKGIRSTKLLAGIKKKSLISNKPMQDSFHYTTHTHTHTHRK